MWDDDEYDEWAVGGLRKHMHGHIDGHMDMRIAGLANWLAGWYTAHREMERE